MVLSNVYMMLASTNAGSGPTAPRPYVTAWRISMRHMDPELDGVRTIYRAIQCKDSDGPMVPPDVVSGWDVDGVSVESRREQYNNFLAKANSAKQHVDGCHHYRLPDACWIIDPEKTPYVDIWIDITDEDNGSGARNRQSVVMIRNVLSMPESPDVDNAMLLEGISSTLAAFRKSESTSAARGKTNDYGRMVPIGTRVPETGRGTLPFAANKHFPEHTLQNLVANLASVGRQCFPQVYAGSTVAQLRPSWQPDFVGYVQGNVYLQQKEVCLFLFLAPLSQWEPSCRSH